MCRTYKKNVIGEGLLNELHTTTLPSNQNVCHVCSQTATIAPFALFGLMFDDLLESLGEGTRTLTFISSLAPCASSLVGEYRVALTL